MRFKTWLEKSEPEKFGKREEIKSAPDKDFKPVKEDNPWKKNYTQKCDHGVNKEGKCLPKS